MRLHRLSILVLPLVLAPPAPAQEPADTTVADTLPAGLAPDTTAQDTARARRDSLEAEIARELGLEAVPQDTARAARDTLEAEIARELGADTAAAAPPEPPYGGPGPQIGSQTLNPDISVIGDFLSDFSPERSTIEEGDRHQMREIELGLQAAVDPYFRGDFFVALKEGEIELEEGFLTTLGLPHGFQAKLGRFHLPFGKVNLTHRPELRTIEYPRVIQEFFGDDGLASAGLWASKIFSPLGFYQELIGGVGNDLGEGVRGGRGEEPEGEAGEELEGEDEEENDEGGDDLLDDLGDRLFLGHFKNSVDLTEAANLEVGLSAATGRDRPGEAGAERLTFYGINAIYRWRPAAAGLYKSVVLQAEAAWRDSEEETDFGAFVFGQYQIGRRWYVAGRYDYVRHPAEPDEKENGISAYLTLFPSEFSLFRLGYEHRLLELADDVDRLILQAVVVLGTHRPHPF